MRITAGKYRNRQLLVPSTGLRPTTDMVRQALFNILGPLDGLRFADLCAGSGSVGLDALSRGAGEVVFVEQDRAAAAVIRKNLAAVGAEAEVYVRPVLSFVSSWKGPAFDIVYLDPPYGAEGLYAALSTAGIAGLVRERLIIEIRANDSPPSCEGLVQQDLRRYGDTALVLYAPGGSSGDA